MARSVTRLRHVSAQLLACARIGCDLMHSLLRPVVAAPDVSLARSCSQPATSRQRTPTSHQRRPFRIISWNIHRNYQAAQISHSLGEIIATEAPDLLLLQEVPIYSQVPFWELAGVCELVSDFHIEYVAMHRVLRQSSYYRFSHSGLATLSRVAPVLTQAHPLPVVSRPKLGRWHQVQRVALHTVLGHGKQQLSVLNLHLENTTGPRGRCLQLRHLLEQIRDITGPLVLGGDFNTLFGRFESVHQELLGAGFQAAGFAPQLRLLPRLDHFFVRGVHAATVRRLAVRGSDHRAIAIDLLPDR